MSLLHPIGKTFRRAFRRLFSKAPSSVNADQERSWMERQFSYYAVGQPWAGPLSIVNGNLTGETWEMRQAYREWAFREPAAKAALQTKCFAVAQLDLQVHPSDPSNSDDKKAAEWVKHSIQSAPGGSAALVANILLPGLIDGFSVNEKLYGKCSPRDNRYPDWWTFKGTAQIDTQHVRFRLDPYRQVIGIQSTQGIQTATWNLPPEDYLIYTHLKLFENPFGFSDLRAAVRACRLIESAIRLRHILLTNYSGPFLKARAGDPAARASLMSIMEDVKANGWVVVPDGTEIEVMSLTVANLETFNKSIEDYRQEIVQAIQGAYLQLLEGGIQDGRGNTQVHKSISEIFQWWLAVTVGETINAGLVPDLVIPNFGHSVGFPRVELGGIDEASMASALQRFKAGQDLGLELSKAQVRQVGGFEMPTGDDDVLPPPAGGPKGPDDQGGGGGDGGSDPNNPFAGMFSDHSPGNSPNIPLKCPRGQTYGDVSQFAATGDPFVLYDTETDTFAEWHPYTDKKSGRSGWISSGGLVRYQDPRSGPTGAAEGQKTQASRAEAAQAVAKAIQQPERVQEEYLPKLLEHMKTLDKPTLQGIVKSLSAKVGGTKAQLADRIVANIRAGQAGQDREGDALRKMPEKPAETPPPPAAKEPAPAGNVEPILNKLALDQRPDFEDINHPEYQQAYAAADRAKDRVRDRSKKVNESWRQMFDPDGVSVPEGQSVDRHFEGLLRNAAKGGKLPNRVLFGDESGGLMPPGKGMNWNVPSAAVKKRAAQLAKDSGVPVVPITVKDDNEVPKGWAFVASPVQFGKGTNIDNTMLGMRLDLNGGAHFDQTAQPGDYKNPLALQHDPVADHGRMKATHDEYAKAAAPNAHVGISGESPGVPLTSPGPATNLPETPTQGDKAVTATAGVKPGDTLTHRESGEPIDVVGVDPKTGDVTARDKSGEYYAGNLSEFDRADGTPVKFTKPAAEEAPANPAELQDTHDRLAGSIGVMLGNHAIDRDQEDAIRSRMDRVDAIREQLRNSGVNVPPGYNRANVETALDKLRTATPAGPKMGKVIGGMQGEKARILTKKPETPAPVPEPAAPKKARGKKAEAAPEPAAAKSAGYGDAGAGHPMAGLDREGQVKALAAAVGRSDYEGEQDPLGYTAAGPPANHAAAAPVIRDAIDSMSNDYTGSVSLDKLYAEVGPKTGQSKYDFIRSLTQMYHDDQIEMGGHPRTLDEIPHPDLNPMISSKVMINAKPGPKDVPPAPAAPEPAPKPKAARGKKAEAAPAPAAAKPSGYGTAGKDHPISAPDREGQVKALADAVGRADRNDESDPLGYAAAGPPANHAAAAPVIRDAVNRLSGDTAAPLDKLYAEVGPKTGQTKAEFVRSLTAMGESGQLNLHDWPSTIDSIPDPQLAPMTSAKVYAYASPGETDVPTATAPAAKPARVADRRGTAAPAPARTPHAEAVMNAHENATGRGKDLLANVIHNAGGDPDTGKAPKGKPADLAKSLVSTWADAHRQKVPAADMKPLEDALTALGAKPVGAAGQTMPFDGARHDSDTGVSTGHPVTVARPGWTLPDGKGGELLLTPAKVSRDAPTAAPAPKPAAKEIPSERVHRGIRDAYEELKLDIEGQDGVIEVPRLYHEMKKSLPGLTVPQFHRELLALQKSRGVELKALNEVQHAKDPHLAPMANDRMLYYVTMPKKGAATAPAGAAAPTPATPASGLHPDTLAKFKAVAERSKDPHAVPDHEVDALVAEAAMLPKEHAVDLARQLTGLKRIPSKADAIMEIKAKLTETKRWGESQST